MNDSNATTKGGANNLVFELVTADKDSTGGGSGGNNPDGGGSDGDRGRIRWDKKEGLRMSLCSLILNP